MSELEKFEKRFQNAWFSTGWIEVENKTPQPVKKDLATLEAELNELNLQMENISLKQLRLANLAQFYAE